MLVNTPFFLLSRDAVRKQAGLEPSAEFILSGVEGLRAGFA